MDYKKTEGELSNSTKKPIFFPLIRNFDILYFKKTRLSNIILVLHIQEGHILKWRKYERGEERRGTAQK